MLQPLTLEQALAITFTAGHAWSPDGRLIGFIHDDGGRFTLRVAAPDGGAGPNAQGTEVSQGGAPVTAFAWAPDGSLGYVQGGRLLLARAGGATDRFTTIELYGGPQPVTALAWAGGARLGFLAGEQVFVYDLDGPSMHAVALPWPVRAYGHEPAFTWSPDGRTLAATILDGDRYDLAVVEESGRVLWRSHSDGPEGPAVWVRPGRVLFAHTSVAHTVRDWYVLDVPPAASAETRQAVPDARRVHREDEPDGLGAPFAPQVHPDGRRAVLVLRPDNWWHLYLVDTETGALRALTGGDAEDVGHVLDHPRISPDGREAVFATNRLGAGQRHLFAVDLETGDTRQVTRAAGNSVEPAWSPGGDRIVFKHSTVRHAPELWVTDRAGRDMRRVVGAMPTGVDTERFPLPKAMTTRGAQDWEIPGYLLTPDPLEPGRRYPALVYVHGGGMRQMRDGFPPLEAYAFHYAVLLWLSSLGVVSYLVNYRGGIGYGARFERGNSRGLGVLETDDCVRAGEFLKGLPFVDPARVGIWGLSYGGWITLAALCRSPETFAVGVNFAGIWDFEQLMTWARDHFRSMHDHFIGRAGGPQDVSPEVWRGASPRHLVERMRAPLINFHGTRDRNVPFAQLDLIVEDCVRHGKVFDGHYYPGETHLFTQRTTWRDAFRKFEAALRTHLGVGG